MEGRTLALESEKKTRYFLFFMPFSVTLALKMEKSTGILGREKEFQMEEDEKT